MTKTELDICYRIRQIRKEANLNQTEFGKKIKVAQGYLTNIETGKRPATEKIVKLICLESWDGKRVNEEWLRTGIGDMFIQLPEEDETAALVGKFLIKSNPFYDVILSLMRTYEKLDDKSQDVLIEFSQKLLEDMQTKKGDS